MQQGGVNRPPTPPVAPGDGTMQPAASGRAPPPPPLFELRSWAVGCRPRPSAPTSPELYFVHVHWCGGVVGRSETGGGGSTPRVSHRLGTAVKAACGEGCRSRWHRVYEGRDCPPTPSHRRERQRRVPGAAPTSTPGARSAPRPQLARNSPTAVAGSHPRPHGARETAAAGSASAATSSPLPLGSRGTAATGTCLAQIAPYPLPRGPAAVRTPGQIRTRAPGGARCVGCHTTSTKVGIGPSPPSSAEQPCQGAPSSTPTPDRNAHTALLRWRVPCL